MKRCFFFDRDGIINVSPGPEKYVERWEDFHLQPAFPAVLRRVRSLGYGAVVITNQRCVATGRLSVAALEAIHRRFREQLRAEHGLDVDDIFYCPHDKGECDCRKPMPGMLLAAAKRHGLDLASSWMVGDADTDIAAGRAAGCHTILVRESGAEAGAGGATVVVASLEELDSWIAEGRLVV